MERGRGPRRRSRLTRQVGRRLRELREERGLTLAEVARRAGTSIAAIRVVESGERAATLVTIDILTRALGVSVESLFSGKENPSDRRIPPDPVFLRLVRSLRDRPRRELEALEKLLAAFDRATARDRA
jgi:transcriptional regulator with XRE-family HTH domain